MNLLQKIFRPELNLLSLPRPQVSLIEKRDHPSNPSESIIAAFGGGNRTAAGRYVSAEGAMRTSAVFGCVNIISKPLSALPLLTYERLPNGGKSKAYQYFLYNLLRRTPNSEQTSLRFRKMIFNQLLLNGNAYVFVKRQNGWPVELIPLEPNSIYPDRIVTGPLAGNLVYVYEPSTGLNIGSIVPRQTFLASDNNLLHFRGFVGADGVTGMSVISYAREAIGMHQGAAEYNAQFLADGAVPRTMMKIPSGMGDDEYKLFMKRFKDQVAAGGMVLIEEGMDLKALGLNAKDSQWLEGMQFTVAEIARFFGVPLFMLSANEKDTSWGTGLEQIAQQFVNQTLRFWAEVFEQESVRVLVPTVDQEKIFCEIDFDSLLRGDSKARAESWAIRRQWGAATANEIREIENQNPLDSGGDDTIMPLNFTVTGNAPSIQRKLEPLLADVKDRIERRASHDLAVLLKKNVNGGAAGVEDKVAELYEELREAMVKMLQPIQDSGFEINSVLYAREYVESQKTLALKGVERVN